MEPIQLQHSRQIRYMKGKISLKGKLIRFFREIRNAYRDKIRF